MDYSQIIDKLTISQLESVRDSIKSFIDNTSDFDELRKALKFNTLLQDKLDRSYSYVRR
jgi:hypothetical protein